MGGRQCGVCRFGDGKDSDLGAPSAACVLLFSCKEFRGREGVLAKMETMSTDMQMPMASAYCMKCRRCTWLSRPDNDIARDCVDFMRKWREAQKIKDSLPLMKRALKVKRGRFK
jgi:hypothetical protein